MLFVSTLGHLNAEELVENGDFSRGDRKWDISGKADIENEEKPELTVELHKRKWTFVEQQLDYGRDLPVRIDLVLEVRASDDFKPLESSDMYSNVDFKMGGNYRWTGVVQPKAHVLIRVEGYGRWYYFPRKLKAGADWQKIKVNVSELKLEEGMITIGFPPGEGTATLRKVSVSKS